MPSLVQLRAGPRRGTPGRAPSAMRLGAGRDAGQLLARGEPVGAAHGQPGLVAALQAGHPDHVELVEVGREDRQELGPLQQRLAGVLGQRQHPGVEVQPGQLAVEVAVVGQLGRRRRGPCRPGHRDGGVRGDAGVIAVVRSVGGAGGNTAGSSASAAMSRSRSGRRRAAVVRRPRGHVVRPGRRGGTGAARVVSHALIVADGARGAVAEPTSGRTSVRRAWDDWRVPDSPSPRRDRPDLGAATASGSPSRGGPRWIRRVPGRRHGVHVGDLVALMAASRGRRASPGA